MKIWTSYFGQLRKIEKMDVVPVAICRYPPKWYTGANYRKLAPSYETMIGMKNAETSEIFKIRYLEETIKHLDSSEVLEELKEISGGKDVVLLCFEKPTDFCHRQLVAMWLGGEELIW